MAAKQFYMQRSKDPQGAALTIAATADSFLLRHLATGNAGNVRINAKNVQFLDEAQIGSHTVGPMQILVDNARRC